MKQTEKISLSGIAFAVDADAYNELERYFDSLREACGGDPDGAEIIADIEARIVELLLARREPGSVVSLAAVREVTSRLGVPERTAADDAKQGGRPSREPQQTFPRRLYRNPEGSRIAGVCSGIGAFLGIDPVWVRVAAFAPLLLLILTAPIHIDGLAAILGVLVASVPLLYIILWFAVPTARTPRQKLEMRGERITASSIGDNMRQERSRGDRMRGENAAWGDAAFTLGRILLFCVKAGAAMITFFLSLICLALCVGIVLALFAQMPTWIAECMSALPPMAGITFEAYCALSLLVLLVPLATLTVVLARLIAERTSNGRFLAVMGGIWLITLICWGALTVCNAGALYESGMWCDGMCPAHLTPPTAIPPDSLNRSIPEI